MTEHGPSWPDTVRHSPAREFVVRFSHVDAAGIVFYPRYIEMLAQTFPELDPFGTPFGLRMEFHKPTPLGECLTLTLDADDVAGGWRLSGTADGEEQFNMRWTSRPEPPLRSHDHEPDRRAFQSDTLTIHAWAAGPDGRLQLSRYYEFVNAAVEQWFASALDLPFSRMHGVNGEGIPTVSLVTRCARLPRIGDRAVVWVRPLRVGTRSLHFESCLVVSGNCMIKTIQVVVYIRHEKEGYRSIAIPSPLRARLAGQLSRSQDE